MNVTLNVLPLPTCNDCGHPVRRARSIREQLCCCSRGTCHTPEPFGCIVCGAFLIGRNDEVLGQCARCQIVTQTPAAVLAPRGAAAGTNRRGPSTAADSAGADVARGEGEAPHPTSAPALTPTNEPESA